MPRPISATIHLAALAHNLSLIRKLAGGAKVWAVVKANAYGHGIDRIFPALASTDGFALLDLDEAVRLRDLGWTGPILLLEGFFDDADLDTVAAHGLSTVIHDAEQIRMLELATACGRLPRDSVDIYLKLNSGMNRLGFAPEAYAQAWCRLAELPSVRSLTHTTHFSEADTASGIDGQMALFARTTGSMPGPRSVANSAATLWHPRARSDWVRAGVALYGGSPSGVWHDVAHMTLHSSMTLASRILAVQDVPPGATIGYGSSYRAEQHMRIGIVACGYADGYPRAASGAATLFAPVRVGTVNTRTVGRISMDMLAVDLSLCPDAGVGTPVELWGRDIPIDEVARAAGTIGYELMCGLAARVPVRVDGAAIRCQ
jgi:alanine racemase